MVQSKAMQAEALDAAGQQGITHAEMMAQLKAKMA